jgi:MHS family proline/betaine transporter-like MFS transporter
MTQINKRSILGGAIGNVLEWYDFAVFGFFAPAISAQFFPSDDPLAGLLKTFGVFAAGYLMRPIGGFLFGRIGDRMGRKRALEISIVAMAVPTSLIAVLPTHAQAGVMAAALLVILRLAQGISVGGEFIGSVCYLVEAAPPKRRCFYGSWSVCGAISGMLLGSAVAAALHGLLSEAALQSWGWRLPFLGGLLVGAVGFWLRRNLVESPEFLEVLRAGKLEANPLLQALRETPGRIFQLACLVLLLGVSIYILFIWMPTYLTHIVKVPISGVLAINTGAMAFLLALMFLMGMLCDRVGTRPVLLASSLGTALLAYPLFAWIDGGTLFAVVMAQVIFAVLVSGIQSPIPAAMVSMFPVRLRYSAIAAGYNITLAIFGGTAPLVATWLIHTTGQLTSPAWYLVAVALVSFFAALRLGPGAARPKT